MACRSIWFARSECGSYRGWRPDDDLVYGTWQDQPLHLLAYKPRSATPGDSAPILLYIHGGGFTRR